jgi:hypothetical protein
MVMLVHETDFFWMEDNESGGSKASTKQFFPSSLLAPTSLQ